MGYYSAKLDSSCDVQQLRTTPHLVLPVYKSPCRVFGVKIATETSMIIKLDEGSFKVGFMGEGNEMDNSYSRFELYDCSS